MNIGMLWFDNDPKTGLDAKIERAASYYRNKYGKRPNVCFIHPTMASIEASEGTDSVIRKGELIVRTSPSVLPNHFWIGVNGSHKSTES